MSAARSSVRVLSTLGRAGATSQFRKLHITGPATFPSLLFSTETQARQQLNTTSTSSESSSDSSAAMSSYRQFHSSPISQAVGDSSTIDFMYFPDFDPDFEPETPPRIPLLPNTTLESTSSYYPPEEVESVGGKVQFDDDDSSTDYDRFTSRRSSPRVRTLRSFLHRHLCPKCMIQTSWIMRVWLRRQRKRRVKKAEKERISFIRSLLT